MSRLEVWASDPVRVMVLVESPDFAGMPDHLCEEMVWAHVFKAVPEEDRRWVEFVYTNVPGQSAAAWLDQGAP